MPCFPGLFSVLDIAVSSQAENAAVTTPRRTATFAPWRGLRLASGIFPFGGVFALQSNLWRLYEGVTPELESEKQAGKELHREKTCRRCADCRKSRCCIGYSPRKIPLLPGAEAFTLLCFGDPQAVGLPQRKAVQGLFQKPQEAFEGAIPAKGIPQWEMPFKTALESPQRAVLADSRQAGDETGKSAAKGNRAELEDHPQQRCGRGLDAAKGQRVAFEPFGKASRASRQFRNGKHSAAFPLFAFGFPLILCSVCRAKFSMP